MAVRRITWVSLVLVAACGGQSGPSSKIQLTDAPSPTAASAAADPRDLVGRWAVRATGVSPGAVLVLRGGASIDDGWSIRQRCGTAGGSWEADGRQALFVASASGGTGNCLAYEAETLGWLSRANGFRVSGARRLLLGPDGATLATLSPAAPAATTTAPTTGDIDPQPFTEPTPLPSHVTAPDLARLLRRWVPAGSAGTSRAFVAFEAGGTWSGSDGCNGTGGRFVLGAEGRLLATSGPSTLVGCLNSPIGRWVGTASRVGLLDEELIFYDLQGKELGRATPAA